MRCLNSVHGPTFAEEHRGLGRRLLALPCVNSVTLLNAELEGRAYGGGMLKVEPREAVKLQVPSPELVSEHANGLGKLAEGHGARLVGIDLKEMRTRVDEVLFGSGDLLAGETLDSVRNSKRRLYERRRGRGGKR